MQKKLQHVADNPRFPRAWRARKAHGSRAAAAWRGSSQKKVLAGAGTLDTPLYSRWLLRWPRLPPLSLAGVQKETRAMSVGSHLTHPVVLIALAGPVRCLGKERFPSPHPAWHACARRDVCRVCDGHGTRGFPQALVAHSADIKFSFIIVGLSDHFGRSSHQERKHVPA